MDNSTPQADTRPTLAPVRQESGVIRLVLLQRTLEMIANRGYT